MTRFLNAAFVVAGLTAASAAPVLAQPTPAGVRSQPSESPSVGAVMGGGSAGAMYTFRLTAPVNPKNALDFDLGRITGNGSTFGVQFRHLFRERSASGASGYVLIGASHVNLESRTEVRWPGGAVTYLTKPGPAVIPYLGIGGDCLTIDGTRIGLELTSGCGEWMVVYAKFFVVWGPRKR